MLSSSAAPSFSAINVASGVKCLGIEAVDSAVLDTIKAKALAFLNSSTSTAVTDAADATQSATSLNALVALPGTLSSAQTASSVSMFERFSASSFALLSSGAATIGFAI